MRKIKRPKILIIYKKSVYEIYFVKQLEKVPLSKKIIKKGKLKDFEDSHLAHYRTLRHVQDVLDRMHIQYCTCDRSRMVDFSPFNLIVTVGGDGTLLSASSMIGSQLVLGVNSNPTVSVGRFCSATSDTFEAIFEQWISGKAAVRNLNRIHLNINNRATGIHVLNDVLICHKNPAAMSHYFLTVQGKTEYQRSSGVWISTAAGSTGASHSAGGPSLPILSSRIVYQPREQYIKDLKPYRLKGGAVAGDKGLKIRSNMEEGCIYIDGSRHWIPLGHGDVLKVKNSNRPLHIIDSNRYLEAHHLRRDA